MQMVADFLEAQSLPGMATLPTSGRPSQVQSNNKPACLERCILLNACSDILKASLVFLTGAHADTITYIAIITRIMWDF